MFESLVLIHTFFNSHRYTDEHFVLYSFILLNECTSAISFNFSQETNNKTQQVELLRDELKISTVLGQTTITTWNWSISFTWDLSVTFGMKRAD